MIAIRSRTGQNYYGQPTEWLSVVGTARGWNGQLPGALFLHGANGTALASYSNVGESDMIQMLSQRYLVFVADLGGNTFGNDTNTARIDAVLAHASSAWGISTPVTLVGASMGGCNALNYALRFPEKVRAVVGVIPGIDLLEIRDRNPLGVGPIIDAAYPPAYDDAVDGPTHSPARFADDLDPDLPIRLWYSDNDPIILPSTVQAFQASRPQTEITSMGAVGHAASSVGFAVDEAEEWLRKVDP